MYYAWTKPIFFGQQNILSSARLAQWSPQSAVHVGKTSNELEAAL